MDTQDPRRRMGRDGRLLDASVLDALLCPGPASSHALTWLEQVGEGQLAVTGWSVLQLEAQWSQRRHSEQFAPDFSLLEAFLSQRCCLFWWSTDDLAAARLRLRLRPALGSVVPLPALLEMLLAFRLGLLPVSFNPACRTAAVTLGYPLEVPPTLRQQWCG
ncbi:MAG: hypothetical protein VKM92_07015 [Cyanobacteriota bacterium]|nr:hypothetical protein [Cyanobacteriota bacterium]